MESVAAQFTLQSLISILVATLCGGLIGFVYFAILNKAWRRATSFAGDDVGNREPVRSVIVASVSYALLALGLFGVTWHASFGEMTMRASLISATLAWLTFIVATTLANNWLERRPVSLTFIHAGHLLLVLLVQAVLIGLIARNTA